MKLIMESWRKYKNEMRDRYLPPGEDPSDPTPEEQDQIDRLQDKVTALVDMATSGESVTLPNGILTYKDFGDGSGQYFLDGEVLANDSAEAEKLVMQTLEPMMVPES
tara:strand:+ start:437 stop:757 length:321 start_codon:yes stop_codon:yes gene_type:complete